MKVKILDKNQKGWYLCKVPLKDYIESLTEDSFNYDIQRGIVTNPYLDTILDSIADMNILPPLSIVISESTNIHDETIEFTKFDILDGLQRTYILWIYYQLTKLANGRNIFDYRKVSELLKQECKYFSQAISSRQVRKLFDENSKVNVWNLIQYYNNFSLYLYVWEHLEPLATVKKMLILNAGQKRMALPHQFELMYLHIFEKYKSKNQNIKLIRSKDSIINDRNRAERPIGEYLIPTIIIGIQSLIAGKPMRLSREMLYKDSDDNSYTNRTEFFFTDDFISKFISELYVLDKAICSDNPKNNSWFSKDTTISGIMGGIGQYHRATSFDVNRPETIMEAYTNAIKKIVSNEDKLQIEEYTKAYNDISSSKFNIGSVVRKAIACYIFNMLNNSPVTWSIAFNSITEKSYEA